MSLFDVIAFNADDTLWHTERLYAETQVTLRKIGQDSHKQGVAAEKGRADCQRALSA